MNWFFGFFAGLVVTVIIFFFAALMIANNFNLGAGNDDIFVAPIYAAPIAIIAGIIAGIGVAKYLKGL